MSVKRGEIYYIAKSPTSYATGAEVYAGRPGIIVSNDKANSFSSVVEVVYLTSQPKRDLPTHVTIRSTQRNGIALCEQITTVSVDRIGDYYGKCSDREMQMIDIALATSLGINCEANDSDKNNMIVWLEAERDIYKDLYMKCSERYRMETSNGEIH